MPTATEALSNTLSFLTAMITPALLVSACGSLILSTSTRLGRVVDRVRALSAWMEDFVRSEDNEKLALFEERIRTNFVQMDLLTSRARLLQRAMVCFYISLAFFVLTSVAIGIVAFMSGRYSGLPVGTGFVGAVLLLYGCVLLIFETRLALQTIHHEMDFIWHFTEQIAPPELVENYKAHNVHFRRKKNGEEHLTK
jgi:hypothetical protein